MRDKIISWFVIFILVIYFSQGSFFPKGTIIGQISLVLILAVNFIYFLKGLFEFKYNPRFLNFWIVFTLINILGFLLNNRNTDPLVVHMFKGTMISLTSLFPFYYLAKNNSFKRIHFLVFLYLMIPLTVMKFYNETQNIMARKLSKEENVVNNISYVFVGLLPFVFFIRKKIIAIGIILICMFYVIYSSKRGALVVGVISVSVYLYYLNKQGFFKNKLINFLLVLVVAYFGIYLFSQFLNENEYLLYRLELMQEGNSSGRNIIYRNIYDKWLNGNYKQLLLGFGFAGSLKLTNGQYAHNDWLELLSNFGMLGILFYLIIFYQTFKIMLDKKRDVENKLMLFQIIIAWFVVSLFSMGYTATDTAYLRSILIGFLLANKNAVSS